MTIRSKPWYREPWPWILMSGPALVVIAGFITAWLAVRSADGLVDDDYYKEGLAVNQRLERDQQAKALNLSARGFLSIDARNLRLFLRADMGFAFPPKLFLRITHPAHSGYDQFVSLSHEGAGVYQALLSVPLKGRWYVALEDPEHQWRLNGEWDVETIPSGGDPHVLILPSKRRSKSLMSATIPPVAP